MLFRFYDGGARERDILTKAYMRLIKHVNSIYKVSRSIRHVSPFRIHLDSFQDPYSL